MTIGVAEDYLDPTLLYKKLYDDVQKMSFFMEITTLPFFNISSNYWLNYPCILYANRPKVIGDNADNPELLDRYLSGAYRIVGYRHRVTNSVCESTFKLQKDTTPLASLLV